MTSQKFMPDFKTEAELKARQLKGLKWTVAHAWNGSPAYRAKFDAAGVVPEDIQTLEDIRKLPFTTAEDLRAGYPFPLRAVPYEKVVRIHSSSGTTGKRKNLCYTQKDVDDWSHFFARAFEMAGVTPEDRVQIAVGYGVWTAGVGFQLACEKLGAMALPVGPGNVDMQCQFLEDLGATVLCCTASMGLLMAEEVRRRGLTDRVRIKKVIYGSERSSVSMREKISELFGGAELFDITGLTELYGPGAGIECPHHDCIHYWADYYITEIVDPDTLEPLPDGEWGEMVVTTLCKEAVPLIRYRTHDITRIIPGPCTCGSIMPRHSRIRGRTDDMFIFRAVNIYPSSIDAVLSGIPGVGSEYQIHLARDASERGVMRLIVERAENTPPDQTDELVREVLGRVKKKILVTPTVEIVDYGTLPRTGRKSKRIFDTRIQDPII
ncbi:phenylacetate--CoA ligase [Desulfonema ishimotonii]|uniref:Phenylacetate-coenzyme A ligase n=1 Tax=Desulfonema ishimotonii TaxID=45657 RepID=A0A401FQ33_9BACT|nr:phenylacetate--CoA ligase [Desulfonema ishimotonii]GBC59081.1 phenylacetate--CoA ligase [Desulfonema ishimotonii]